MGENVLVQSVQLLFHAGAMIASEWLLYLGAAVFVLIALRVAGAFSRRGQSKAFHADLRGKKSGAVRSLRPKKRSRR